MNKIWFLVNSPKILQQAIDDFDQSGILCIDTEYDSFRYFREKLCLIQIKAKEATYIFDPLDKIDLSILGHYFADRKIVKVFHAADNDIRLLKRDYNFVFDNIFDTSRAAHILGFEQLSLEKMIKHFLGIDLKKNKKMQRSRWDNRPLAEEQLLYGVQDVVHLPALYAEQRIQLQQNGLIETARHAFVKIAASNWQEKIIDKRGYTKIAGYHSCNSQQKDILKKLYRWRFERAKEENRAIFMFLPDTVMSELAQAGSNWRDILPAEKAKHYGEELERILTGN